MSIKKISFGLLVVIILGYSYYQARNILTGPLVEITYPPLGATLEEPIIIITGKTRNISSIKLNDGIIFVDDYGNFAEKLVLYDGYNIIKLEAKDRFGKPLTKFLEVTLKAPEQKILEEEEVVESKATTTSEN